MNMARAIELGFPRVLLNGAPLLARSSVSEQGAAVFPERGTSTNQRH
jgi:hypothetical protein